MKVGNTFVLKSKAVERGHPKIVITDPHDGKVVVPSITEWADNKDQACILEAAEDKIIKKRSVVSFRDATIVDDAKLEELLMAGEIIATEPISDTTLDKILYGCGTTRFIKQGPYDFLDQLGLIPLI